MNTTTPTTENTSDDNLYFGDVQCLLSEVDGESFAFDTRVVQIQQDGEKNRLLQTCSFMGPEYNTLILPSIPGVEQFHINYEEAYRKKEMSSFPTMLRKPLMKNENGNVKGIQSGIRSALVKHSDKWIRLKGCGNMYEQFPIRPVDFLPEYKDCVNIRGCCFENTCIRELYYSNVLNELLIMNEMPCTNVPIGWFEYNRASDPMPLVKRMCSAFITPGDKRLNDHVIVGLELLLNHLTFDDESLLQRFPDIRFVESSRISGKVDATWWTMVLNQDNPELKFADIYHTKISFFEKPKVPEDVPRKYHDLWNNCCQKVLKAEAILAHMSNGPGNLFSYLYWRFGREVGQVQKLLHTHDISWGTYSDLLGDHCNAHPNNFVLLPPSTSRSHFLAPVDFDMAFSRSEFTHENSLFDEWMHKERQALALELGGAMLSTGLRELVQYEQERTDRLRWALRDTMLTSFYAALRGLEDIHPICPELDEAAHALLKLALIMTSSNIA